MHCEDLAVLCMHCYDVRHECTAMMLGSVGVLPFEHCLFKHSFICRDFIRAPQCVAAIWNEKWQAFGMPYACMD